MKTQATKDHCLGRQVADNSGTLLQDDVWRACEVGIEKAIQDQLENGLAPVVIDGLPTVGKTTSAGNVVNSMDAPATILTHLHDTRNAHIENATEAGVDMVKLPSLEKDCPTASGEYGDEWQDKIKQYNQRGASPKFLHMRLQDELPCMRSDECEYLERWEDASEAELLVGHPVHANLPEVVEDRIVVFDEDPEDAFRTKFTGTQRAKAVKAFLDTHEEIPLSTWRSIRDVASADEFQGVREKLRDVIEGGERIDRQSEALNESGGHALAPAIALAALKFGTSPVVTLSGEEPPRTYGHLRERVNLEYVDLPHGMGAVNDTEEETLYIRDPPDLSSAVAVVGLDGTPTQEIWEGRLGFEDVAVRQILCDDCRQEYLRDTVGYRLVQTTKAANPYSSGNNTTRRKNYGLIEAVASRHQTQIPVITTKKAEEILFENEPAREYVFREQVKEKVSSFKHYGKLRSSNDFEGEEVGIVIGSPHPGDRAIQVTAAFEGYLAERGEGKGMDLSYGIPEDPILHHYREQKVAQAIFRYGRTTPTTVYVHTAALPSWLREIAITPDEGDEVEIKERGNGMRAVMHSLVTEGGGTVSEIADREAVDFTDNHVRDMLKRLRAEGAVAREGNQPYNWVGNGIEDLPHTAVVTLPDQQSAKD